MKCHWYEPRYEQLVVNEKSTATEKSREVLCHILRNSETFFFKIIARFVKCLTVDLGYWLKVWRVPEAIDPGWKNVIDKMLLLNGEKSHIWHHPVVKHQCCFWKHRHISLFYFKSLTICRLPCSQVNQYGCLLAHLENLGIVLCLKALSLWDIHSILNSIIPSKWLSTNVNSVMNSISNI